MDMRKFIGLVILIHLAAGASEDDPIEAIQDGNDSSMKEADEEVSMQVPTPTRLNLSSGTQPGLLDSHNTEPSFPNSSGIKTTNVPRFQELKTPDDFRDISLQVSNKRPRGTGRNFRKRRILKNLSSAQEVPPYINTNLNIPHISRKNKQDIEKQELPDNHESGTLTSQKTRFPKVLHAKNTQDYTNIPKNHYFPNAVDTNVPQIPEINLPPKPSITPAERPIPHLPSTNITHTPPHTSSPEMEDVLLLKRSAVSNPDDPDNTISEGQHLATAEHPKISTENISAIINTLIQNISDSKVPQIIEITLSPVTPITPVELPTQKLPLTNNTSTPMQIDSHPETLYTPELELPGVNTLNHLDSTHRPIPELDTSEIVNPVTRNLNGINVPQIPDFNIPPVPTIAPKELPIPELPLTNSTPIPQIFSPQIQNVPELEVPAVNKPHYPDIPSPEDQDIPVVEHPKIPEINMSKIVNPAMQNISDAKVQQIPGISLPTIPAITQAELPIPKLPVPNATHIPQISTPQMKDVPEFNLQSFNKPNYPDIPLSQGHDLPNVGNSEIPKPNIPAILNPVIQNMSDTNLPSIPDGTSLPPITTITQAELPELPVPMLPLTNYTNIPQLSRPQITDIPLKQPAIIKPDDPDIPILERQDLAKVEHTKIPNLNTSTLANPEVQQSPDFKIPPFPTVTTVELPTPSLPFLNDTHIPQLSEPPTQETPKLKLTAIIEPNITKPNDQNILIAERPKLSTPNISAIVSPFIQNKSDATATQTPDFNISPVPTITPVELAVPKLPITNVTHIPQISNFQSKDIPEVNLPVINKPNYPDIPMLQGHDLPNAENPEILKPNVSTIVNPEEKAQIPGIILPPIPTMAPKEVPISGLQFTNITHAPEISGPQTQDIPKLNLTAIVKPRDLVITSSQGQDFPIAEHSKIPELNTSTVNQIIRNISDERIPQIPDNTLPPVTAIPPAELPIPKLPLTNIANIPPISRPQIIDIPGLKQPTIIKPDDPGIPILESDGHPEIEHPQIPELNTSTSVNPVIHNISNTKLHQIPAPPVPTITPLELPTVKLPHTNITHMPQINGPQRPGITKLNLPPINKPGYPDIPVPEGHELPNEENNELSELNMSTLINPVIQKNISDTKLTPTPDIPLSPITPITPVELPIKQLPVTNFTQIPQNFSPQIQNIPELKVPPFNKQNYPDIPSPKSQDLLDVEHPKLQVINMSIIVNPFVQNTSHSKVQQIPGIDLPHIPAIAQNGLPIPELTITNITHTIPKMSSTQIQEVPDLKELVINKLNYPDTPVLQGHDIPSADNHEILKPNVSTIAKPVKIVQIPEIKLPPIPTISPKELPISDPQFINVTEIPEIPSLQTQDILGLNLTAVVKPKDIIIKSATGKDIPIPDQPEIPELNTSTAVNPIISNMGDKIIPEIPDTLPPITVEPRAELPIPKLPFANITNIPLITRPPLEDISELILPAVNKPNYPDIPIVEDLYLPNVEHPTIPRVNMPTIVDPVIQNMSVITPTSIPAITPADLPVPNLPLADVTHIPQVSTRQVQDVPIVEYPEYQELNRSEREKPLFSDISGNQVPEIPDVELNDTRAIHPPGIVTPHLPEVNITHSQQFSNAEITPVPNLNLQDIIRQISSVNPETVNLKLPNISLPVFSQDDNKLNLTNIPAFQGLAFPKDEPDLYLPIFLANANKLNCSDIPGIKIPDISNLNLSMVLTPVTLKLNDATAPEIHYVHSPQSPPIAPLKLNFTNKSQRPILEIPAVPNLHLTLIASDCPE